MSTFLCSFSSSLDDIPEDKRKDDEYVLEVLRKSPRFSCFEASEHQELAETLTRLKETGRITYPDPQPEYPWNKVEVV